MKDKKTIAIVVMVCMVIFFLGLGLAMTLADDMKRAQAKKDQSYQVKEIYEADNDSTIVVLVRVNPPDTAYFVTHKDSVIALQPNTYVNPFGKSWRYVAYRNYKWPMRPLTPF